MSYVLYGYWRSSASYRVRIALGLKGVPFEYRAVNLLEAAHRGEANVQRNPMGQVPTLEWRVDGKVEQLTQSMAIFDYLETAHPSSPLLPNTEDGGLARARVVQMAEIINAGIQPLQNLPVLKMVDSLGGDKMQWGRDAMQKGFVALEAIAVNLPGPFLCGDAPTIADICLVPQLYNARRFELALDAFPTLLRAETACLALPAFINAHPDQQPDAK